MIRFFFDFFWFPFAPGHPSNKFGHVMQFVMKDFPLYFWVNPSRRSLIKFPFAVLRVIWQKTPSETFGSFVQLLFFCMLCCGSVLGYSYRTQQDPRLVICQHLSLCWGENPSMMVASHGSASEDPLIHQLSDNTRSPNVFVPEHKKVGTGKENMPSYQQSGLWILDRYRDSSLFAFGVEDKLRIQEWWLSGTLAPAPSGFLARLDQTLAALASSREWTIGTRTRLREDLGRIRDFLIVFERNETPGGQESGSGQELLGIQESSGSGQEVSGIQESLGSGQEVLGTQESSGSGYEFFLRSSVFLDPNRSLLSRSAITRLQRTMALLESRGWNPGSSLSEEDRTIVFRLLESIMEELIAFVRGLSDEGDEGRARDELLMILTLLRS